MRYYRRRWEGKPDGDLSDWGPADYFLETDDGGAVLRQVEVYANGSILRYDHSYTSDRYGQLSDQPLDINEFEPFGSDETAFDQVWPPGTEAGAQLG